MAIKDGNYMAKGIEAALGMSRNEVPQIEILFQITSECQEKGKQISYIGYFSGNAKPYVFEAMRKCGWKEGEGPMACCRNEIEISVVSEEYRGRVQQKVQIWGERKGLWTKDAMAEADAAAFLTAVLSGAEDTSPAPAASAAGAGVAGDDLPF